MDPSLHPTPCQFEFKSNFDSSKTEDIGIQIGNGLEGLRNSDFKTLWALLEHMHFWVTVSSVAVRCSRQKKKLFLAAPHITTEHMQFLVKFQVLL